LLSSREYVGEEDVIYKLRDGLGVTHPIRFGHKIIDGQIPGGISPYSPGFYLVQGPMGSRKTTFVLNMMINMHFSPHLPKDFTTFWWNVESLMTQEQVQSMLRAMIATKIVVYKRFNPEFTWERILGQFHPNVKDPNKNYDLDYDAICAGIKNEVGSLILNNSRFPREMDPDQIIWPIKRDAVLSAQFIKSGIRFPNDYVMSPDMYMAYITAGFCMAVINFYTEGTSEHSKRTVRKQRSFRSNDLELSGKRWLELAELVDGNCQFVVDHTTAFEIPGSSEYEKQRAIKPHLKAVIDEFPLLFWVVIQDGIGNQRDFERYGYVLGAAGGDVLGQEVNVNWRKLRYDREKSMYWDVLQRPIKSRVGDHPAAAFMLAPHSGAYIGEAQLASAVMP
jgi:hypothetical protein